MSVPITNINSAVLTSPDFEGESEVSFQAHSNESILQIPRLDFYDVVSIEFSAPEDDDTDDDASTDDEENEEEGCGC